MRPTLPPHHQWVETADGSFTLFSENFQEACHSTSGARAETFLHYIQGCQIKEKLNSQNQLSILEVGFGLGIGFLTTYDVLQKTQKPWSFLSLEIDEKLLEWFRLENQTHPFLKNLKWSENKSYKILEAKNEIIHLQILCGDARKTLPAFTQVHQKKWNAIYQDAFSPKKTLASGPRNGSASLNLTPPLTLSSQLIRPVLRSVKVCSRQDGHFIKVKNLALKEPVLAPR